jgi:hypothetical protein
MENIIKRLWENRQAPRRKVIGLALTTMLVIGPVTATARGGPLDPWKQFYAKTEQKQHEKVAQLDSDLARLTEMREKARKDAASLTDAYAKGSTEGVLAADRAKEEVDRIDRIIADKQQQKERAQKTAQAAERHRQTVEQKEKDLKAKAAAKAEAERAKTRLDGAEFHDHRDRPTVDIQRDTYQKERAEKAGRTA